MNGPQNKLSDENGIIKGKPSQYVFLRMIVYIMLGNRTVFRFSFVQGEKTNIFIEPFRENEI